MSQNSGHDLLEFPDFNTMIAAHAAQP